jgi:hypothetical protein
MIPGPDNIISCPYCNGLAKYGSLVSGNTFGATLWTDGRRITPMLPHPTPVVKCEICSECYWLSKAKEIGAINNIWDEKNEKTNPDWESALNIIEPTEEEYYVAIEKGIASDESEELEIRTFTWWKRNDKFRNDSKNLICSIEGVAAENLQLLIQLLDKEDDNSRLMKAEAHRELGCFKEAKKTLNLVTSDRLFSIVQQMINLCDDNDNRVRELNLKK